MKKFVIGLCMAIGLTSAAAAQDTPSAEGASVYFVNIEDGATVSGPVTVVFGLDGMGIAPAGVEYENSGHHHLLINRAPMGEGEEGAEELLYGIPADENHIHYGKGQTQATLDLPAGTHTLQLVLGDLNHVPHVPPVMSDVITITVE
ncbi:DUF4399 domain-containing protein [Tateyamaria sp. SN6-1]|uniref:DUF4399 domain-containing protein n=1 Tax=Tateyamaria sp. SN6-1 TaxID=3092148 RepID=UPI0039F5D71F